MSLYVRETFVNATEGHMFSEGDWYESSSDTAGDLYRELQSEYGRCVSKIYREPTERQVGWVFQGRSRYEDTNETYLREVWVEVSTTKPERHMVIENVTSPWTVNGSGEPTEREWLEGLTRGQRDNDSRGSGVSEVGAVYAAQFIAELLDGRLWQVEDLETIAQYLRDAGFKIGPPK